MCHPDPERTEGEGSRFLAQGKLREESHEFLRFAQDMLRLTPQNDIVTQSLDGGGLGWPPAQRASGSERGGQNNLIPLPFTLLDKILYSAPLYRKRSI